MTTRNRMVPALLIKIKVHLDQDFSAYRTAVIDILTRKKKSGDVSEIIEAVLKRNVVALYLHNKLAVLSTNDEDGTDAFDPQWSIPSIETEGVDEDGTAFAEYKQKLVGIEQHAAMLKLDSAEYSKTVEVQIRDWLEADKAEQVVDE